VRVDVAEASAPMKRLPGDSGGTMPFLHNLPCPPFAMQGSPSPSYPRSSLSYPPSVPPPPSVPGVRPGASQGQGQGHCALNLGTDNKTQQSPVRKHRPGGAQGDDDHDAQPRARDREPPLLRTSTLTGPSSCCLPRGQCGIRTAQILGGMGSMQELGAHTAGERAEGSRRARDTTRFTADLTRRPASSDWN